MVNNKSKQTGKKKNKILLAEFSSPSYEEWRDEATGQLKGHSFEKNLITKTTEEISLKPIYNKSDIESLNLIENPPGFSPYLRGKNVSGYLIKPLETSQKIPGNTPEQFNDALLFDLKRGQTAVNLVLDRASRLGADPDTAMKEDIGNNGVSIFSLSDISTALKGVDLDNVPIHISAGISALPFAVLLFQHILKQGKNLVKLKGSIDCDPLGFLASEGYLPSPSDNTYDEMHILTDWCRTNVPELKTIGIDTQPYHNGGCNAVDEIAFAVASGTDYLREMLSRNLDIDTIAPRFRFTFSLGSNFFTEIAKLRAARFIWARVIKECGGNKKSQKMTIHACTTLTNITTRDPYVNLLRMTTESFSGVIGGCDSLQTGFFDHKIQPPSEFSRRISRNIQIILNEESHLDKVIDPAGGSWYIESLTSAIAEKAWKQFQTIEKKGGMFKALTSGYVQDLIAKTAEERYNRLAECKDVLIGASKYPDTDEKPLAKQPLNVKDIFNDRLKHLQRLRSLSNSKIKELLSLIPAKIKKSPAEFMQTAFAAIDNGATLGELSGCMRDSDSAPVKINAVKTFKGPELFESIRQAVENTGKISSDLASVFLANLGKPSQFRKRSDYAVNFFGIGGYEIINNDGFDTVDQTFDAVVKSRVKIVVICSSDEIYNDLVPSLLKKLKGKILDVIIIMAGNPVKLDSMQLKAEIDEYIYEGINVVETLTRISKRTGAIK